MIIRCPNCEHSRKIPDHKIPANSEFATCPKCSHRFRFRTNEPFRDARPLFSSEPKVPALPPKPPALRDPRHTDIWEAMENLNAQLENQLDKQVAQADDFNQDDPQSAAVFDNTAPESKISLDEVYATHFADEEAKPHLSQVEPAERHKNIFNKISSLFTKNNSKEKKSWLSLPQKKHVNFDNEKDLSLPKQNALDAALSNIGYSADDFIDEKKQFSATAAKTSNMATKLLDVNEKQDNTYLKTGAQLAEHKEEVLSEIEDETPPTLLPDQHSLFGQFAEIAQDSLNTASPKAPPRAAEKVVAGHVGKDCPQFSRAKNIEARKESEATPLITLKGVADTQSGSFKKTTHISLQVGAALEDNPPEKNTFFSETENETILEKEASQLNIHASRDAGSSKNGEFIPLSFTEDILQSETKEETTKRQKYVELIAEDRLFVQADVEDSSTLDAVFARHNSGCSYSFEDKDKTPEQKADNDVQLLLLEAERPSRDLGKLAEGRANNADIPFNESGSYIPWENTRLHGWLLGFIRTIYGVLFNAPLFFSHLPSTGSLAPAYLFFLVQSYVTIICTSAWKHAFDTFMESSSGEAAASQGLLPILLITAPIILGFFLLLLTGVIKALLGAFALEKAHFSLIFKMTCYASAPLILSIIPFIGPLAGGFWFLFAFATSCRSTLLLNWRLTVCAMIFCLLFLFSGYFIFIA